MAKWLVLSKGVKLVVGGQMNGLYRIILIFKFRAIQSFFLFVENWDNLWKSEKVGVE